ncbi:MAG: antitoxin MazE family protein [Spirochaetota bacterium]
MIVPSFPRVKKHRDSLRAQGLRPLQIWVPDSRKAGFAEECRRQSNLLRNDPLESQEADWAEEVADRTGWE